MDSALTAFMPSPHWRAVATLRPFFEQQPRSSLYAEKRSK